ncbi:MAG TPA: hypothetical protein VLU46_13370 [Thermoanaerobaculia bacterium]|nr:hypothetical protein [Thermoanaerobaculia bacterium]
MAAHLRKHAVAYITLAAFHVVFFFPVFFMGRVVSPNDVFFNYEPWATYRPASMLRTQNTLLNDPATAYLPLMTLVKNGWSAFQWNPYVGGGIPGFGSSASAVLSPFVFFPALAVPLPFVWTAMLLLKLNIAFFFAYAWLREERLGKRGAAIGAIVIAAAGVYTARWLWQITNATALYPALLWVVRRTFNGKRTPIAVVALIALSYALSGFPAAMAYGAWLVVAYVVWCSVALQRDVGALKRAATRVALAVILGLLVAAPSLVPFVQFLKRSGYLDMRVNATAMTYPLHHARSFLDPLRLGNPANKTWAGDRSLPVNNFIEASIYVGASSLALALLGLFARRRRAKWFWIGATIVVLAIIFGFAPFIGRLPGFKYSPLERVVLLLPVPVGFLAAAGAKLVSRRTLVAAALGAIVAFDLGHFAGSFFPYLRPAETEIPTTPVISFLQRDTKPFRFVGLLTYMWPNSAEMFRIEDVASHFGSEAAYRRIVQRIDKSAWTGTSTVIQFNSLTFNFRDPLVSMLGVRYFLEHRSIDIVKWTIFGATVPGVKESGATRVMPGQTVQRAITVDTEPFWSVEVPVSVEATTGIAPSLYVDLVKNGRLVWSRTIAASDVAVLEKIYVPLRPYARLGETVVVRLRPQRMIARMLKGGDVFYYGRVTIPLIFDRELPDGRLFRNLAEVPRFHAVKRVRKMDADHFIATKDIDFADEAVITDGAAFPPPPVDPNARVRLTSYAPAQQRVVVESEGPMFLASSEKLTPELRVSIDGARVRPLQINALFAGVNVPGGKHEVVFSRRIGRGWWPAAILAALAIVVSAVLRR